MHSYLHQDQGKSCRMLKRHLHFAFIDTITNKDVLVEVTRDPNLIHNIIHGLQPRIRDAIKLKVLYTSSSPISAAVAPWQS